MSAATLKPETNDTQWSQAQNNAADAVASAREMASHAACAAGSIAKQAVCDASHKADDLTAKAGVGIEHMGQVMSDRLPHAGVVGQASQAVAQSIQHGGQYLEDAKLSGAAASLKEMIRRHPVESTLAGLAVGYLVARASRK